MASQSDRLARLVASLETFGPEAEAASRYIQARGVRISFHQQSTGARWRLGRRVELNPAYLHGASQDLYLTSLILHEVKHLQQGVVVALSVYGELEAWRLQFGFLHDHTGRYHEDPEKDRILADILSLPLSLQRQPLNRARILMRDYAGPRYRVDLLPLFPIGHEILWLLLRQQPITGSQR